MSNGIDKYNNKLLHNKKKKAPKGSLLSRRINFSAVIPDDKAGLCAGLACPRSNVVLPFSTWQGVDKLAEFGWLCKNLIRSFHFFLLLFIHTVLYVIIFEGWFQPSFWMRFLIASEVWRPFAFSCSIFWIISASSTLRSDIIYRWYVLAFHRCFTSELVLLFLWLAIDFPSLLWYNYRQEAVSRVVDGRRPTRSGDLAASRYGRGRLFHS